MQFYKKNFVSNINFTKLILFTLFVFIISRTFFFLLYQYSLIIYNMIFLNLLTFKNKQHSTQFSYITLQKELFLRDN